MSEVTGPDQSLPVSRFPAIEKISIPFARFMEKVDDYDRAKGSTREYHKTSIINFIIGESAICLGIIAGFLLTDVENPWIRLGLMVSVAVPCLSVAGIALARSFKAEDRFRAGADFRIAALVETIFESEGPVVTETKSS